MIVDTSALVAIAFGEADAGVYAAAFAGAASARISAANYVEAAVVIGRQLGFAARPGLDLLMRRTRITVAAVDAAQARIAVAAYRLFGRGSGHPARLNMGDCFAYALAKATGEPLLYKGRGFALTDVASALPPPPL